MRDPFVKMVEKQGRMYELRSVPVDPHKLNDYLDRTAMVRGQDGPEDETRYLMETNGL